jgi:hypothetical protein
MMSEEDNVDEVYYHLMRSRSEEEREVLQEVLDERMESARQKSHKAIEQGLFNDVHIARRWLNAIADHRVPGSQLQDKKSSEDNPNNDAKSEVTNTQAEMQDFLRRWASSQGQPHGSGWVKEDGSLDGKTIEGLVTRTARRLQNDCFRLLNLVAYLTGRERMLQIEDVNWIIPYLNGHLRILRGDYQYKGHSGPNYTTDLDLLASQHALEMRPIGVGDQLFHNGPTKFEIPDFDAGHNVGKAISTPQTEAMNDYHRNSAVSPKTKHGQIDDDTSPRIPEDIEMQEPCPIVQSSDNVNIPGYDLSHEIANQIRKLETGILQGRISTEKTLSKALAAADRLLKSNSIMGGKLAGALSRIEQELKHRKAAEIRISELSHELNQNKLERDDFVTKNIAIEENVREEREFRTQRSRLQGELREAQSWLTHARREDIVNDTTEMYNAVKQAKAALEGLENERELAWLNFVASLDGLSNAEIVEWKALRRGARSIGTASPLEQEAYFGSFNARRPLFGDCLYCVRDDCEGCRGHSDEEGKLHLQSGVHR